MGDANDLTSMNTFPPDVRIPLIKNRPKGSLLPKERFIQKLEGLVGQRVISHKRIISLAETSLKEENLGTIDVFLNYFPSVEEGFDIATKYFTAINYSENQRGYVLQK